MQSLWSRAASSHLTCRCVSCLSTTAQGVTSRSAGATAKKRLRIGNSVTVFYTSIFAAAALADARAKAQRRHDWEEKIAAVKAEVNELVDEEQRILESLYSSRRTSIRGLGRMLHTRGVGAVPNLVPARPGAVPRQPARSFHTGRTLLSDADAQPSEKSAAGAMGEGEISEESEETYTPRHEPIPHWVIKDEFRMKAIQKLALKQFAIRLLLRPVIAHNYSGIPKNYEADFDVPQINVEKLLYELNRIRSRINSLKTDKDADFRDVLRDYTSLHHENIRQKCASLDAELDQDIQLFMNKQMSVEELLMRTAHNLLDSADPDRTAAFRYILIAFTRARQNDVCDLLLRTILPNRFYLSTSLIITIISFFRKSKNLKDFDLFIQMLGGRGWSTNVAVGRYIRRKINGVEIIVPPLDSSNPVIYAELIAAALRFDQPDRADAWLQAARKVGFFDNFNTLLYYLRFYSIRQDWQKGSNVLKRAVTYLVSSADHSYHFVERLLMLMVHLCDSCRRKDVSEALISAAMQSGFDPRIPSWQMDIVPTVDPDFTRWTIAAEKAPKENIDRPLWQKCYDFANAFGDQLSALEGPKDDTWSQQYANFAARHAQESISLALDGISPHQGNTGSSPPEPSFSHSVPEPSSHQTQAQSAQNGGFITLKDEVAQLRELVDQLRKHYTKASSNDDAPDLEDKQDVSPPPAKRTSQPSTSDTQDPIMKVKFERKSNLLDRDTLRPSPRKPRRLYWQKRRAALIGKMPPADPSLTASDTQSQTAHSMQEHAKGSHTEAETQSSQAS